MSKKRNIQRNIKVPVERAEFNLDDLSYGEFQEFQAESTIHEAYGVRVNAAANDASVPIEDVRALLDQYREGEAKSVKFLTSILVAVPESYLVRSAPKDIDWSDPASVNHLKATSFNRLTVDLQTQLGEVNDNVKN